MQPISIVFYLIAMPAYVLFAGLLLRALPYHWRYELNGPISGRLTTLDGLRGALALSVLISHIAWDYEHQATGQWLDVPSNFYDQMGVMPVTLFFFITGYLFWSKLLRDGNLNTLHFYRDRIARLGPAYWTTFLGFLCLVLIASRFQLRVSLGVFLAQCFGWATFLGAGHDINAVHESRWWFGQAWTLRLEWMFYLTLPLLVWFARKRGRIVMLLVAGALSIAIMSPIGFSGLFDFIWKTAVNFLGFLTGTFSIGMLTAVIKLQPKWTALARSKAATLVSAALMGITAFWIPPHYGVLESVMLAVPFFCVVHGNDWFGALRSVPMRFAGRISYSIYLMHTVVMQFSYLGLTHLLGRELNGMTTFCLVSWCTGALSIFVAAVSWQYLERPFMRGFPALSHQHPLVRSIRFARVTAYRLYASKI